MGGFEDWVRKAVAELLERLLGTFVAGINAESLRLDALGGDLTLHNLGLRLSAFEALDLPVAVADGRLGLVRVKVPWRNFDNERVIVSVQDVFLLLTPKDSSTVAAARELENADGAKREALSAWEALQEKKKEVRRPKPDCNRTFLPTLRLRVIRFFPPLRLRLPPSHHHRHCVFPSGAGATRLVRGRASREAGSIPPAKAACRGDQRARARAARLSMEHQHSRRRCCSLKLTRH